MSALSLRAALKRGALVTAANWPIVLVDLTIESLYKFALAVPVIGGAFVLAVLAGDDLRVIFAEGFRPAADLVMSALGSAPATLIAFFSAVSLVAVGGGVILIAFKSGTFAVIVAADWQAGELHRGSIRFEELRGAYAYDLDLVMSAVRHFARRSVVLTLALSLAYGTIGILWVVIVAQALGPHGQAILGPAWPLLILVTTSASLVALTAVNLAGDLLRIIIVSDDCSVRVAAGRLRVFLTADARQVLGIFGVMLGLLIVAFAISLLVAASLTFVAWVPIVGLIALPLQMAGWLVRGLVFQYVGLTAMAAYQTQYRRSREPETRPLASTRWIQPA